jgi:hypothetical protein
VPPQDAARAILVPDKALSLPFLSRRNRAEGWGWFYCWTLCVEKVVELSEAGRKGNREEQWVVKSALIGVL